MTQDNLTKAVNLRIISNAKKVSGLQLKTTFKNSCKLKNY